VNAFYRIYTIQLAPIWVRTGMFTYQLNGEHLSKRHLSSIYIFTGYISLYTLNTRYLQIYQEIIF
jgi:hypothetical protein